MTSFSPLPPFAAWRHRDAREGFEVVFPRQSGDGYRLEGHTAAVEAGEAWSVGYAIDVGPDWRTRRAQVTGRSASGRRETALEGDGSGHWRLDGEACPHLDGCFDVDLESSSFTNAMPIHRLGLAVGQHAEAPAAYVRALDLSVERLEQAYARLEDDGSRRRFDYTAPRFDFRCVLVYDESGLVLDYPGIASRIAND
ncbi:MAG TPA: putative glycolipid-binding domain-containing protein [Solirubrobacterales bacterium]|nr:putative glycolipid-binding domain-containing protein [Solirubrobacterales bacterium]